MSHGIHSFVYRGSHCQGFKGSRMEGILELHDGWGLITTGLLQLSPPVTPNVEGASAGCRLVAG